MLEVLASGAAGIAICAFLIGQKVRSKIKNRRLSIIRDQEKIESKTENTGAKFDLTADKKIEIKI